MAQLCPDSVKMEHLFAPPVPHSGGATIRKTMMETVLAPHVTGRSSLIIALGILGFLLFGPLTGLPALKLAKDDLDDLRAGRIAGDEEHSLRWAKRIAIAGTFFSPLWLVIAAMAGFMIIEMTIGFLSVL